MASKQKKTSTEAILATLMAGGETSDVSPLKVLLALASNPESYARIVSGAQTSLAGSGLDQFDPEFDYDPTAINPVLDRYEMMPEKYIPFVRAYFGTVAKTGGNENLLGRARAVLGADESYGLSRTERDSLLAQMSKDAKSFMSAEQKRQQAQYKAYLDARKKSGITGVDTLGGTSEYLQAKTGIKGLPSDLPTTVEALSKKQTEAFRKRMLSEGKSEKMASEMAATYAAKFLTKAKEKKINPLLFGLKPTLKKNILGG